MIEFDNTNLMIFTWLSRLCSWLVSLSIFGCVCGFVFSVPWLWACSIPFGACCYLMHIWFNDIAWWERMRMREKFDEGEWDYDEPSS